MTTTTRPKTGQTTYHRDGTVTMWDCIQEQWVRIDSLDPELSATLSEPERSRIARHVGEAPCGSPACLTAESTADAIYVEDEHGGIWHPSDEALAEILASDDPEAAAVRICHQSPLRGAWKS